MPMTDRPPDETIEDDVALDSWYKQLSRDMARRAAQRKGAAHGVTVPKITDN